MAKAKVKKKASVPDVIDQLPKQVRKLLKIINDSYLNDLISDDRVVFILKDRYTSALQKIYDQVEKINDELGGPTDEE